MRRLLPDIKHYRKEIVLAPLFKMIEALLELLVPLIVAAIVDVGIAGGDGGYVLRMSLLLVGLGLSGLLFSVTAQFFAARAAVGYAGRLRSRLFKKMQALPFSTLDRLGAPTMVTRMTGDVNQVQTGVNMGLRLLLRSPFVVFGAMIMAFTVDTRAAVVFAVVIPVLGAVVSAITLLTIPLYRKVQQRLDRVVGLTRENLTGVRVIRAFGQEERENEKFREQSRTLRRAQLFVGRLSALLNPLTYVIINLAAVILIRIGAIRVDIGDLTQGEVVALYNYLSQILVELIKLADLIVTLARSVASGKRIAAILACDDRLASLPQEIPDRTGREHIVFDRVSMIYPGASGEAVSDLSFSIKRGETVGIIGGTGSGKTTLVSLIPHFYDASSGRISVDGIDVRAYPTEELRSRIGIVMQRAVLFSGTVRDNLRMGKPDASDAEMKEALAAAQASEVVSEKGGLDARVEQGGRNFSGGQKQRLTIARALVRRPDILILDDSSSALDYATDARLRAALRDLPEQMTVLIISQRTASLSHADRILVLDEGRLVGIGTHAELLRSCPVYREIHFSQFPDGEDTPEGGEEA